MERLAREVCAGSIINCTRSDEDREGDPSAIGSLIDVARRVGARLVHVGSAAEYGSAKDPHRISERHALRPVTAYGRMKANESLQVIAARRAGRDPVVGRVFNMIGPGEDERTVAGAWAARVSRQPPIESVAVPRTTRDFVDVRDAARALLVLGTAPTFHAVYNICSGRGTRIDRLVRRLIHIAGIRARVRSIQPDRGGAHGVVWSVGSPQRISALGWRPSIPVEQSLRDVWAWFEERGQPR